MYLNPQIYFYIYIYKTKIQTQKALPWGYFDTVFRPKTSSGNEPMGACSSSNLSIELSLVVPETAQNFFYGPNIFLLEILTRLAENYIVGLRRSCPTMNDTCRSSRLVSVFTKSCQ